MNIFARELVSLLGGYGKEIGSLYGLHSPTYRLLPSKVTRLKRSLTENITATLNADDLDLLVKWLKLDPNGEEIRRLRAALLAEMIRYLLGGRMEVAVANNLGEVTFQLLIGKDPGLFLTKREELLGVMRGGLDAGQDWLLPSDEEEGIVRGGLDEQQTAEGGSWMLTDAERNQTGLASGPLEPALEAAIGTYEQGALWLEIARDTHDAGARQGYLAQADTLLRRAQRLAGAASTAKTEPEREWLTIIETALTVSSSLLSNEQREHE